MFSSWLCRATNVTCFSCDLHSSPEPHNRSSHPTRRCREVNLRSNRAVWCKLGLKTATVDPRASDWPSPFSLPCVWILNTSGEMHSHGQTGRPALTSPPRSVCLAQVQDHTQSWEHCCKPGSGSQRGECGNGQGFPQIILELSVWRPCSGHNSRLSCLALERV